MSKAKHTEQTMIPEEVAACRDDEELFILDVRNEDDYEEWHIEGSHNLPVYDQLLEEDFTDLKTSLDEIPDDKEIVVVCRRRDVGSCCINASGKRGATLSQ